ncbi:Hypothetical predicted protein [Mytilus galloprovincialis]|uniref:RNB domain-containing protein n=2 Tax=Mytilus galloprovincialis TaxID=29158 RepID=A0A8B6FK52_MYTGA|nr:Hypothetical predicted protein [Mytilus galloprovincialis]
MSYMDSDSDNDWYDEETNRRRNRLKNIEKQQNRNTDSLLARHESSWFHEGLEINRYEYIRTEKVSDSKPFLYPNVFLSFDETKYITQPEIYKKCTMKILSSEEAICVPEEEKNEKIYISGRANCGQTYTEDTVYVKISNKGNREKDKKYYGEVVSFVDRKRFKNVSHPVFVCLIDRRQSHLMIPICKTVPKICILHGRLVTRYPERLKTSVEIHKHDSTTNDLKFHTYHNITDGDKENWLFFVVLLKWKLTNINPLGAVIGVVHSSQNIEEGLTLIALQNRLHLWLDYPSVEEIRDLKVDLNTPGYENLTKSDKIFTIAGMKENVINHGFSIREIKKNVYKVGVHITDVSQIIQKGDAIDLGARSRGFSIYGTNMAQNKHLLPDHINHLSSLEPGRRRYAISVYFEMDQTDSSNIRVSNKTILRTILKSTAHYNYLEIEHILDNQGHINDIFAKDIQVLFCLSKKLRLKRLRMESFTSPVVVDFTASDSIMKTKKAHTLVEEYLSLASHLVGSKLTETFSMNIPVFNPTYLIRDNMIKQKEWYSFNEYYAHLLCGKQEEYIEEVGKLSIENAPLERNHSLLMSDDDYNINGDVLTENLKSVYVPIQSHVLHTLLNHARIERNCDEAIELICSDFIHPKQALALLELRMFEPVHQYKMSIFIKENQAVQFTCPLSRYCDIIIQRLIHAYIDQKPTPYEFSDLHTLCANLNKLKKKRDDFHVQCKELVLANHLKTQPVIVHSFISNVSSEKFDIFIPGLQDTITKTMSVKFSDIDVCNVPEVTDDNDMSTLNENKGTRNDSETAQENGNETFAHQKVTVKWRKRLYSFKTTLPPQNDAQTRPDTYQKINPHVNTSFVSYGFWKNILKHVFEGKDNVIFNKLAEKNLDQMMQESERNKRHIDSVINSVTEVTSEVSDPLIINHFVPFQTSFGHGQIVSVQLSSQESLGILAPVPQIVILTDNIKFCLPHVQDPIKTFLRYAKKSSLTKYKTIAAYRNIWLPIVEMESTYNALQSDDSATINELPIRFKKCQGIFELDEEFCDKRDLHFGYIPEEDGNGTGLLINQNKEYFPLQSGNFLCIMKAQTLDGETKQKIGNRVLHKDTYLWSGHAETTKICKYQKLEQRKNGGRRRTTKIRVAFQLHENSSPPPATTLDDCRLEIIYKSSVDRRNEIHLKNIHQASDLAKKIAVGKDIPFADRMHTEIANEIIEEGLDVDMWENNLHQYWAIKTALQRRFKLIQGPPGTGKTYIGVKLVYLFDKFNTIMQQRTDDSKNQIIFCGPSNRSVDLVARLVIDKLGSKAPRIVRMYGSAIEQLTFPIPGRASVSRRNIRDAKADTHLVENGVVLHNIIRQDGKPYAARLKELDKQFSDDISLIEEIDQSRRGPLKTTIEDIKEYKDIQSKATKEDLPKYDVIFCTTSLVANPKVLKATKGRVYQLIIDESGMCSEPATIVPIIATYAKQVILIGDHKQLRPIIKCKEAARLGLGTSLFERYSKVHLHKTMLKEQYRMVCY